MYLGIVDAGAVKGIRLSQYQVYIVIHAYTRKLNVVSSWNQLLADFSIPKSPPLRKQHHTSNDFSIPNHHHCGKQHQHV